MSVIARGVAAGVVLGACTSAAPSSPQAAPVDVVAPSVVTPPPVVAPVVAPVASPPTTGATVTASAGSPEQLRLQAPQFMYVFRGRVVLAPRADEGWGVGPARWKRMKGAVEGTREIDSKRLPPGIATLPGSTVKLYGAGGALCTAKLAEPVLYGYQQGSEIPASEDASELPSEAALVAGFRTIDGRCDGALWARAAELPAPELLLARPDAKRVARVREAAAREDRFTAMAASFEAYVRETGAKPTWAQFLARTQRVGVWQAEGAPAIAVLEVGDAEAVRCDADFSESLSLVYQVDGEALSLLSADGPWRPASLFRVDDALAVLAPPSNRLGGVLTADFEVVSELRFPSEDDCGD